MAPSRPTSNGLDDSSTLTEGTDSSIDGRISFRHNSKTHMSTLQQPIPTTFPPQLDPPRNIPTRHIPLYPALDELDAVYNQSDHPMLGRGRAGEQDEFTDKEATTVVEQHVRDRLPYIQLQSQRLQAILGVRNEQVFDLPQLGQLPIRIRSPSMRSLADMPDGVSNHVDAGGMKATAAAQAARQDSGVNFDMAQKSPVGMTHTVDKETGKGLREFLLQKGKEHGMRKQECRGISLFDFTPCMKTGAHKSNLLAHFGADKAAERVDLYEVDLPTTHVNEQTGEQVLATETWIWILISRPVVSFDPCDHSTYPAYVIPAHDPNSPASREFTLLPSIFRVPHLNRDPETHRKAGPPTAPPNFPHPVPSSWVIFAAPKAHVTTYPEEIDPSFQASNSYAKFPSKKVGKRMDFDFSFSGMPLFEFSSRDLFSSNANCDRSGKEFLSIEKIGRWHATDPYLEHSSEEYKCLWKRWKANVKRAKVAAAKAAKARKIAAAKFYKATGRALITTEEEYDDDEDDELLMPAPNKGMWWKEFYARKTADCQRWEKVKMAMGRGKCRVVVQWVEREGEDLVLDVVGAGKGFGGKRGVHGGKRMTRAETRRRSALGIGQRSPALGGISGALGESAKARAIGNRDLGRLAAIGSEREKSKGKKR